MPRKANHRPPLAGDNLRLPLACLECQGRGLIPWKRLDGVFYCRACALWFRLGENGRLTPAPPPAEAVRVQVRSDTSTWKEDIAPLPPARATLRERVRTAKEGVTARLNHIRRPLLWLLGCGVLALAGLLITLLLRYAMQPPSPPVEPLPSSLEARARLFAEAWVFQDSRRMMQLTDPAADRAMIVWQTRTPPPAWARRLPDNPTLTIEVSERRSDSQTAEVEARVWSMEGGRRTLPGVLRQRWAEKDGSWFFVPPPVPGVSPVKPGARPPDPDLYN